MQTIEAFNDMIYGTTAVYTSEELNDALGMSDQLVVQVIASQASSGFGILTMNAALEESNNGQDWLARDGGLSGETLSTTVITALKFADAGTRPFQAYLRLRLNLGGLGVSANIKVLVTGRNDR